MSRQRPLAFWLAVTWLALSVVFVSSSWADNAAQLDNIRDQSRELKKEISQAEKAQKANAAELERTERALAKLKTEIADLQSAEQAKQREIAQLRGQRAEILAQTESQREALSAQARAAYLMGRQHQIKLLLNQEDPTRVGRMLIYHAYFNRQRTELLSQLQAQLEALKQIELETQAQAERLAELKQKQAKRQESVAQKRAQRVVVLAKLSDQLSSANAQLKQLQADERRLTALTERIRKRPAPAPTKPSQFQNAKGQLMWPVSGRMSRRFGQPRGATGQLRWRGVVIDAEEGMPVKAVDAGKVVFADWLRGYGFLVIVDHGNNYMSLYGHNQRLLKSEGDRVQRDEKIAMVGDSGGYGKTALYFEIRHKGKPIDPKRWIAKAR